MSSTIWKRKLFCLFVELAGASLRYRNLIKLFAKFGSIKDLSVVPYAKFPTRTYGLVTFESEKDSDSAISALDGTIFNKKVLTVQKAKHLWSDCLFYYPERCIYIPKPTVEMTRQALNDTYGKVAYVDSAYVVYEAKKLASKVIFEKHAYILFAKPEDVTAALEYSVNFKCFGGKAIVFRYGDKESADKDISEIGEDAKTADEE
jgi:hypothetical protein